MKSKKKGKAKENIEEKINIDADTEKTQESVVKEVNVDFKDKYIRLYSEFENYRKRTAKEKIEIITNASKIRINSGKAPEIVICENSISKTAPQRITI